MLAVVTAPLDVDHQALVRDRTSGMSLTNVAKKYGVSRASVVRFAREAQRREVADVVEVAAFEQPDTVDCIA